MRKVLGYGLIAFLVWFIVTRPDPAAKLLKSVGGLLVIIATGLGSFVSKLS